MNTIPLISIIIPTLNSRKTIGECLESILKQDYPKDRIEIIIADGGSTDGTIDIINSAKAANLRVLANPLKTGEAGKAAGAKAARSDISAFIDSDNILPSADWLKRMTEPFLDPVIIAAEPIRYAYRKTDNYITRYCALMGMNDPLCLFLGNYDRYNYITGKWTGMPCQTEKRQGYLKIGLDKRCLPTIGANGFLIRTGTLNKYNAGEYLFDIDVLYKLLDAGYEFKIAKVDTDIVHIFCGGFVDFTRKQRRRITDYAYYKKLGLRKYKWTNNGAARILKFVIYTALLFPLIAQATAGYARKKDGAWFFHIPACVATLVIYSFSSVRNFFITKPASRDKWQEAR